MVSHPDDRITARQRSILMLIVERYIASGEPVGSGTVAAGLGPGNNSPATIRNEMTALTLAGLLEQPHTSAGRLPTARAFRLYVEALGPGAGLRQLAETPRPELDARFADVAGTDAVLARTSKVLAALSSGVGVALAAMPDALELEHVHFSRLAARRVLAVVVTRGGTVRDRVLAVAEDVPASELERAGRLLNDSFRGWSIPEVRAELLRRVERERSQYQRELARAEQLWAMAVPAAAVQQPTHTVYVEGVSNLVGARPLAGVNDRERLRDMLAALEAKQRLVELLTAYIDTRQESVRVVFELEEQAPEMAGLVLIAAPATQAGEPVGLVGVIGPTRMQYGRTIDAVGYLAQVLDRQGAGLRG